MPVFRNAMFGFHKEDVYRFITEQSKQYESKIDDLTKEVARKEEELKNEKRSMLSRSMEFERLQRMEADMNAFAGKARGSVRRILEDEKEIAHCADLCENQAQGMLQAISSLEARLQEAELLRGKAEKFDQLSSVLSSIINGNAQPAQEENTIPETDSLAFAPASVSSDGTEKLRSVIAALSEHCEELMRFLKDAEAGK